MSYLGTTEIGKMFLGDVEIDKAYLGNDLVFSSESGPAPVAPVFYDYLYFDGTAYVDTDYVLPSMFSLRAPLGHETVKASQVVFYATGGDGGFRITYTSSTTTTNRRMGIYYDSTSINSSNRTLAWSYNEFNFFVTPLRFGWGSTAYTYTRGSSHPTGGLSFGYSSNQPYTGRMGLVKIYGSDAQNATTASDLNSNYTPVATFCPCTYNGAAGFWYVEGNKFYGNTAGSGTLIASNS